jgi:hypothetical protein
LGQNVLNLKSKTIFSFLKVYLPFKLKKEVENLMKKIILLMSIIVVLFSSTTVFAEEHSVECTAEMIGEEVCISGRITNATKNYQVALLVGDIDNILHIDQKATEEDGSFNFTFGFIDRVKSGTYDFKIGTSAGTELYEGTLVYTKNDNIVCESTVNGRNVSISGQILNASSTRDVNLLVGDETNVIYTGQTASADDGSFSFNFKLPVSLPSGNYSFIVETDAGDATYCGVLVYESNVEVIESQFFGGNITVSLSNYVPTISGNVNCIDGKEITFDVINSSDNTVIVQDTITAEDGIYNLNYVLPSLVMGKDYTATISCSNETKTLFSVDVDINSSIILVEVNGDVQVADDVKLEANIQTTNTDLINKSATITSNKSISTTIPNLVANMSCDVIIQGYEQVVVDSAPSPDPEPDPDPAPLPDEEKTVYSVEGSVGSLDRITINVSNIPLLHEKIFTINYNSNCLELIDVCSFTNENELTIGAVKGTYIEILSVMDGQVKFKINKMFSDNVVTSGVINMMTFQKNSAEAAVITSKIEKTQ